MKAGFQAVLLMAAYTSKRDEHVRIGVFTGDLGPRGTAGFDRAGIAVMILPLWVATVFVTWRDFVTSFVTGEACSSREKIIWFRRTGVRA
ncbi:hypothetical protein [Polaromonas sp.]|uniref:hypothetical protein n=1 Tax=Polaromonas sp. TaxID=1869339 RepID=UPI003BB7AE24